ncbi:hypothetical protein NFI96_031050 [Prochilodus magdalenae]|nr:hypothetical protein NFI96_031050 [Prochilodus magdalenae]
MKKRLFKLKKDSIVLILLIVRTTGWSCTVQICKYDTYRPDVKAEVKEEESKVKPAGSTSNPSQSSTVTPKNNSRNSHSSTGSTSDCSNTLTNCRNNQTETAAKKGFPSPQVPYPCYTALNHKERVAYLQSLKKKNCHTAPQDLMTKVQNEVSEFMKYLQDVSKVCADNYKYVPTGAARYLEEYFKACSDHMMGFPQIYSIQEITSLTSGKYVSNISLNFEKQLLAMGNIEIVENKILPDKAQLSVDYDSVSSVIAPFKKAKHFHRAISSDRNAEKLSATYEPHVCLAKEAFLQLLNNSSGFTEAWELPVWVKENPGKGSTPSKTVYIDPPLLKTQMTWRERSHLFHEESVKLAYKKTGSKPVFFLATEDFSSTTDFVPEERSSRAVVSFEDTSIDFEVDVTDLESFGESYQPNKKVKGKDESKALSKNQTVGLSNAKSGLDKSAVTEASTSKDIPLLSPTLPEKELKEETVKTDAEDSSVDNTAKEMLIAVSEDPAYNSSSVEEYSSSDCPRAKRLRQGSVYSLDHSIDSDEERLIIDHPGSPLNCLAKKTQMAPPTPEGANDSINDQTSDATMPLSPTTAAKGAKKGTKRPRVSGDCDQLGHILRMQNAMLKSAISKGQKAQTSECRPPEPKVNNNPHSLVKPCVSSYLESGEGLDEEAATPIIPGPEVKKKRLLRDELLASAEDEADYEAPEEGSVLYKLYSLLDVLLMVRSTVEIAHPRHDQGTFRAVPVQVLPKLEYQLCYGGESLTHTEACLLWGEHLLHSSTASFIGRINAHTSTMVQLQELSADWIQKTSCDFRPARCLNTLHHILKKVMGLQEGRYLLGHKPGEAFVTIFKASEGKKPSRSIYDLQAVHCGPPVFPLDAKVPWVPLDPFHLMPFHQKHNRPPCIFPPCPHPQHKNSEPTYPTVVPAPDFDPDKDAARIETAIKTKGVDEQTIIQILTKRTYSQRREIAFAYERRAKKDMISALKGALSGSLETVILGLMKSTAQYDASEIKASIKGLGTDEESLIEILCSRSTSELLEIKKVYKELFKKDLEKDVAGDTSGDFAKLLLALVEAKRAEPSNVVDYEKIDEDARALYDAGVKRKGTDVKTWIAIMSERSVPHLQKVFERYKSYSPYDMQESIRKEVKGDLEKSFLTLVQCFENKQLYFANRLSDAMKSKGAKEKVVTRIMVSRCEVDLKKIRSEFKTQFGKSLYQTIAEHTKGDYQTALLSLCAGDD